MSILAQFNSRPKWVRVLIVTAILGAILVALLFTMNNQRQPRVAPQRRAQTTGVADMPGMEGMSSDGTVTLTTAQLKEFGTTFGAVEQRLLAENVRTAGVVVYDETRLAVISPKFDGVAERLYVGFTGAPVKRGQPVLEAYSPELIVAQEELLVAARMQRTGDDVSASSGSNTSLLNAAKLRLRLLDVSNDQIESVLRTGRSRRTLTLYAPVGGVVVEKNIVAGQAFQKSQAIFRLADLSSVWIEADIREAESALVRIGNTAQIEVSAMPGRVLAGRVDYVYPSLQADTRTVKARISVSNPGLLLKPGMYTTVRLQIPTRTALTVPVSALVRTGERDIVFADMGNGRIMPMAVRVGQVTDQYAEIIAGVEPGQRIVTSAQFLLDSESNVAEVMKGMIGQMNAADVRGKQP